MNYIVGIDIGGTSVKIGLFDTNGDLKRKWSILTNKEDNGKYIMKEIYQSLLHKKVNLKNVVGYGFGVPGPVVSGTVLQAVNIGWYDYDLALEFSQLVGNSNVHVGNDANVAALGEVFKGAAKGKKDIAMITLGTGIGGGIIIDGHSIEGVFGAGGELGHIVVEFERPRQCNCGSLGCLETIASATGIKREFTELAKSGMYKTFLKNIGEPSAKKIFDAAIRGDELSNEVINRVAYALGYACHMVSLVVNPEVIVFGGGVSRAGEFLFEKIRKEFSKYKFYAVQKTQIVGAELGNDAGMFGAAYMVANA